MKTWDLLKCEQGQGFGTVFLVRWHTSEKKKRRIYHLLCIQCLVWILVWEVKERFHVVYFSETDLLSSTSPISGPYPI